MSDDVSLYRALASRAARGAPYWLTFLAVTWFYLWLGPTSDLIWLPPLLLAGGIAPLAVVIRDWSVQRVIRRSDGTGREGHWSAIHGRALAEIEQDHDILACHFRITSTEATAETTRREARKRSHEDNKPLRYEGVFQVPTSVDTGEETIRLCGFPNLTDAMPQALKGEILENAKAQSRPAPSQIPAFLVREMLINRPSRQVELALQYGKDPEERFRRVDAWALRERDKIWVLGKLRNKELSPVPHRALGLPAYFGTKEEVLAKLQSTRGFFIVVSGILLIAAISVSAFTLI